ncbi:unnamed protein product, partial [Staurois parvus]
AVVHGNSRCPSNHSSLVPCEVAWAGESLQDLSSIRVLSLIPPGAPGIKVLGCVMQYCAELLLQDQGAGLCRAVLCRATPGSRCWAVPCSTVQSYSRIKVLGCAVQYCAELLLQDQGAGLCLAVLRRATPPG